MSKKREKRTEILPYIRLTPSEKRIIIAEQKIFYSKVTADKSDLTKHPIPILNRVGEEQFNQLLETNLIRIDKEVKYLVDVFLSTSIAES